VDWIHVAQNRIQYQALLNTVTDIRVAWRYAISWPAERLSIS